MNTEEIFNFNKEIESLTNINELPEKEFDAIAELTTRVCKTPIASISLISNNKQFYKSTFGCNGVLGSIGQSLCMLTANQPNLVYIIHDTKTDKVVKEKAVIVANTDIVFYAGIQLLNASNKLIGVLSIYDYAPRTLTETDISGLQLLANQIVQLIELHNRKIELVQSEIKYKSMIEHSIIPILFSDPSTERVIDANIAACKLFGYTIEEFKTLPREVYIIHGENTPEILKKREESGLLGVELIGIKKNGEKFQFEVSSSIFKNNNGDLRSISFINDVTLHKKAEQELKQSEINYKYLFQNNPAPMYIWDFETLNIVDCNESALSKYGYSRDEFLKMNVLQIRPPEEIEVFYEIKNKDSRFNNIIQYTTKHKKKNGVFMNVKIHAHIMEYNGRKSSLVLINDITENLKIKNEIIASEKKYKTFFEKNPSPMFIWDFETYKIIECNDAALIEYGYTKEEFLQLTAAEVRPKEELFTFSSIRDKYEKFGKVDQLVTKHQKKNGVVIDVKVK